MFGLGVATEETHRSVRSMRCWLPAGSLSILTSSSFAVGEVIVENEERIAAWISFIVAMRFFSRRRWTKGRWAWFVARVKRATWIDVASRGRRMYMYGELKRDKSFRRSSSSE